MKLYHRKVTLLGKIFLIFMLFIALETSKGTIVNSAATKEKVILERLEAIEKENYHAWWEGFDSLTKQEKFGNNFEEFKKWASARTDKDTLLKSKLKRAKRITAKRAWFHASSPSDPNFKGFYLIKEKGGWKIALIKTYLIKTRREMKNLKGAIIKYFNDKGGVPSSLQQLIPKYVNRLPRDPFDDKGNSYGYISGRYVKLYSIGPDSDDDYGSVVYIFKNGPVSDGDIITSIELD